MSTLVTEAIVLHAFDYLETSRIIRLMTRDAGVQSVIARGARNSRRRFGSSVDLFAQGTAEIRTRPNRELHSLDSLDVTRPRPRFALDVGRFTAGSMIAELALRTSNDEPASRVFDSVELALDRLSVAEPRDIVDAALGGAWHIISALGFSPTIDVCANCDSQLDGASRVAFSHSAGGALCARCGERTMGSRIIPAEARHAIREWLAGGRTEGITDGETRAHQRLLREFFQEHLGSDKPLRAYRVWEHGAWTAA